MEKIKLLGGDVSTEMHVLDIAIWRGAVNAVSDFSGIVLVRHTYGPVEGALGNQSNYAHVSIVSAVREYPWKKS